MKEFSTEVTQHIDDYLLGKMSAVEQTQFETEIASNLELKNEVELQQQIINQIQNKEILRIKNHLNTINVTTTSVFLQTKAFIGYAAIMFLGAGGALYSSYVQHDNNPFLVAQTHNFAIEHINYYAEITPVISTEIEDEQAKNNDLTANNIVKSENTEKLVTRDIQIKTISSEVDEDTFIEKKDTEIESFKSINGITSKSEREIMLKDEKSKKLMYKFENEKLYLYGVNENYKPYILREVKNKFSTEYYLELKGKFYKLNPLQIEKVELSEIENESLIKELNKIN